MLREGGWEVVQFGGPVLELVSDRRARSDPRVARLGQDVLGEGFDAELFLRRLRGGDPGAPIGDALLDQRTVAGIGNVWKSEACFGVGVDPWRALRDVRDEEALALVGFAREGMRECVREGHIARPQAVYRRAGRPCPRCGAPIRARAPGRCGADDVLVSPLPALSHTSAASRAAAAASADALPPGASSIACRSSMRASNRPSELLVAIAYAGTPPCRARVAIANVSVSASVCARSGSGADHDRARAPQALLEAHSREQPLDLVGRARAVLERGEVGSGEARAEQPRADRGSGARRGEPADRPARDERRPWDAALAHAAARRGRTGLAGAALAHDRASFQQWRRASAITRWAGRG